MLDNFTSGDTVSKVLIKAKNTAKAYAPMVKQPSLSIKLFSCTDCKYKSKALVYLKNHIMKNHKAARNKCELCGFESTDYDVEVHMK